MLLASRRLQELRRLLAQSQDRRLQAAAASNALTHLTLLFPSWLAQLQTGSSLLLHGYGCKKALLLLFAQHCRDAGYRVVTVGSSDSNAASVTPKRLALLIADALKSRHVKVVGRGGERKTGGRQTGSDKVTTHSSGRTKREEMGVKGAADTCARGDSAAGIQNSRDMDGLHKKQSSCPASLQQHLHLQQQQQQQQQPSPPLPAAQEAVSVGESITPGELSSQVRGRQGGGAVPGRSERQRLSGTVADRVRCLLDIAATSAWHLGDERGRDFDGVYEDEEDNEVDGEEEVEERGGYGRGMEETVRGRVRDKRISGKHGTGKLQSGRGCEQWLGANHRDVRQQGSMSEGMEQDDSECEPVIITVSGFDSHPLCHADNVTLLAALAASGVVRLVAAVDNVLSSACESAF